MQPIREFQKSKYFYKNKKILIQMVLKKIISGYQGFSMIKGIIEITLLIRRKLI